MKLTMFGATGSVARDPSVLDTTHPKLVRHAGDGYLRRSPGLSR